MVLFFESSIIKAKINIIRVNGKIKECFRDSTAKGENNILNEIII